MRKGNFCFNKSMVSFAKRDVAPSCWNPIFSRWIFIQTGYRNSIIIWWYPLLFLTFNRTDSQIIIQQFESVVVLYTKQILWMSCIKLFECQYIQTNSVRHLYIIYWWKNRTIWNTIDMGNSEKSFRSTFQEIGIKWKYWKQLGSNCNIMKV